MDRPITIRAQFAGEIFVSHHSSARREENLRYEARGLADLAVQFGADWAQAWIGDTRTAWLVSHAYEQSLGLQPQDGMRRVMAQDVWDALELQTPVAATLPPAWQQPGT